ncbi:UNVERIFIED_CONTAM: hypothetical protein NY603_35770, partial [Bacteroidetes bacterium 56_B9]
MISDGSLFLLIHQIQRWFIFALSPYSHIEVISRDCEFFCQTGSAVAIRQKEFLASENESSD